MTWRARVRLSYGPLQTTWTCRAPVDSASDVTGNAASNTSGANAAETKANYERSSRKTQMPFAASPRPATTCRRTPSGGISCKSG